MCGETWACLETEGQDAEEREKLKIHEWEWGNNRGWAPGWTCWTSALKRGREGMPPPH